MTFNMAAIRHLGVVGEVVGQFTKAVSWWLFPVKFRHYQLSSVQVISIWFFVVHAWKSFHRPKISVFEDWLLKVSNIVQTPKKHIVARNDVPEPSLVEIGRTVGDMLGENLGKFYGSMLPLPKSQINSTNKSTTLTLPQQHNNRKHSGM